MKKNDRNLYLTNINVDEAVKKYIDKFKDRINNPDTEKIEVIYSLGRVSADPIFAKYSSPNYNASAMDGIAVIAEKTYQASENNAVRLINVDDYMLVDTGDPIIEPYNAVIMIEDVEEIDENTVEITKAASPWQHIRPIGEDIVANEMIIPIKHKIRPVDIGALLSGGITKINVYKKPTVGIIPTGTEIVEPGSKMEIGSIIESNSRIFEGLTKEYGGIPNRYSPVVDNYNKLKKKIMQSVKENDITIINAGSSAGTEDYTVNIIRELGEVIVHGIASKPGKPAILGVINNKPVMGIPGYPVSAYLVFDIISREIISRYQGILPEKPITIEALSSRRIVSSLKHREYVRIKLGKVGDKLIATPLNRGAGVTMSLVRADGVLIIPQNSEGVEAGEKVNIQLYKNLDDVENTIVSIGSHDLIMDMFSNYIHKSNSKYNLSSAHVGSMGGIMSLRRKETHISPIHLLDENTGKYNISFIVKYLNNMNIVLVKGIKRIQGFMVNKNNPKNISNFIDIANNDIIFVNRQKGAGTRLLTDYMLKKNKISASNIIGYEREMTTHMAVAAAVASGSADVGVGVYSAAKAMGLDFIPISEEEYDFAIPEEYLKDNKIQLFIEILKDKDFQTEIVKLGGYKFEEAGKLIKVKDNN